MTTADLDLDLDFDHEDMEVPPQAPRDMPEPGGCGWPLRLASAVIALALDDLGTPSLRANAEYFLLRPHSACLRLWASLADVNPLHVTRAARARISAIERNIAMKEPMLKLADDLEPRLARALAAGLRAGQRRVNLEHLVDALERDQRSALALLEPLAEDFAAVSTEMVAAFMRGAEDALRALDSEEPR